VITRRSPERNHRKADNVNAEVKYNSRRYRGVWHETWVHLINPRVFARGKRLVQSYCDSDTSEGYHWLIKRHLDLNRVVSCDCASERPRRVLKRFHREVHWHPIRIRQHRNSSEIEFGWGRNCKDIWIRSKCVIIPKCTDVAIDCIGSVVRASLAIPGIWGVEAGGICHSSSWP
jgi:hypothetical protein